MPRTEVGPELGGDERVRPLKLATDTDFSGLRAERDSCEKVGQTGFECLTEMEFLKPGDAKKLDLPKGTRMAIHKCVLPKSRAGEYRAVTSTEEATKVASEFCACVQKESSTARKKCSRR